ncbi:LysR family transcriptional regulator [Micromonospora eburnea]|uniref:DNA-binding transcriptional regulator, LysR family n=1 Tax=Micromonospora eburnea TaxID=227316 RepID=A0A1C6V7R5_9ACTN|nr:LysR family transcriptional regulator [Micromonospora eburnea]SCL62124.1 DNA-binding transcriptional regulator, LysR family [Micromonospora eburnea]
MVELRQLRYFLAVAEERSFSRAAALLHVSQPTLSQQIRAVERSVGAPLFHREPTGVRLTEAGFALLEPAQRAMVEVADGVRAAQETIGVGGTLRVGFSAGGFGDLIPSILPAWQRAAPEVRLILRDLTVGGLYTALIEDRIDVALTRLPLDPERHDWTVLFAEPRVLGLNVRHPLADAGEAVSLADVLTLPMPRIEDVPTIRDYWLLNEHRDGCPPQQRGVAVTSPAEIAYLILQDPSLVAVGPRTVRGLSPLAELRFIELSGVTPVPFVAAARRHDRRAAVLAFRQVAATVARRLHGVSAAAGGRADRATGAARPPRSAPGPAGRRGCKPR